MTTIYSFEENVKNFNKMFNNLNPNHFDKFTYLMAEAVVRKVKLANELAEKLGKPIEHEDKLRDVQIWCRERLYLKNALIYREESESERSELSESESEESESEVKKVKKVMWKKVKMKTFLLYTITNKLNGKHYNHIHKLFKSRL